MDIERREEVGSVATSVTEEPMMEASDIRVFKNAKRQRDRFLAVPESSDNNSPIREGKTYRHEQGVSEAIVYHKRCHTDTIPDNYLKLLGNRYRADNSGPFTLHIEKITPPPELQSSISVLKLGKVLLAHLPDHMNLAYDFKRMGHGKFSLSFQH